MLRLDVPSMHCEGCVRGVTRAVNRVAPAAKVSVDLAGRAVSVEGTADERAIVAALARAGFHATHRQET